MFLFKKILPNTTISQIAVDNILLKKLLLPLNDFDVFSQIKILAGVLNSIPEDIMKTLSSKPDFSDLKNKIKKIIEDPSVRIFLFHKFRLKMDF